MDESIEQYARKALQAVEALAECTEETSMKIVETLIRNVQEKLWALESKHRRERE